MASTCASHWPPPIRSRFRLRKRSLSSTLGQKRSLFKGCRDTYFSQQDCDDGPRASTPFNEGVDEYKHRPMLRIKRSISAGVSVSAS